MTNKQKLITGSLLLTPSIIVIGTFAVKSLRAITYTREMLIVLVVIVTFTAGLALILSVVTDDDDISKAGMA